VLDTRDYSYDAYGNRLSQTVSGSTLSSVPNGTSTYGYDVHGSVSQLVDANGNSQASYGYKAYGQSDGGLSQGDPDPLNPVSAFRYSAMRMDTGSNTVDMGARRFGPDVSRFLTPDLFFGALSNLSLSLDPITQNRYGLAGGNPISFKEWDGHVAVTDGGGGAAATPSLAPDRCGGCDETSTSVQRDTGRSSGSSGGGSSVSSSLLDAGKEALTKCFKKGDPSDFGFAAAVLSPICNPEKRTVPNPQALCSLTASNATGLGAGVRVECAAPPDLQHDPVLKAASSTGGDPEEAFDAVISRGAARAQERQAAKEEAEARGGVYVLKDADENVVRTGRTNDLARRQAEHARDYPDYIFEVVYRTDDPAARRGLEQMLYDRYPSAALNKIRPISEANPRMNSYLEAAQRFLSGSGS
jgi:RHS repeat-associated protein